MKLFSKVQKVNWKYILGETLLIFVGINLAIWFNNWNTSQQNKQKKRVALEKIQDELKNNLKELKESHQINQQVYLLLIEFTEIYDKNTDEVITSPQYLKELQAQFPNFYEIHDSSLVKENIYRYSGSLQIVIDLPVLNQVAWETTKSLNISNEFNYDCLYELESIYNLQRKTQKELDKVTDALQKRNLNELTHALDFLAQLVTPLIKNYVAIIKNMEHCNS